MQDNHENGGEDGNGIHPASRPIDERVWNLERELADSRERLKKLENPEKKAIWKDRTFLAGLLALPSLVLVGWVATAADKISGSRFFEPMPFLHTLLGTETAVRAYVAPDKPSNRGEVRDEILALFGDEYVTEGELDARSLISTDELNSKGFLTREALREAAEDGEIDGRIRGIGGRRQNFNDFFVERLGLNPNTVVHVPCGEIPEGEEVLEFQSNNGRECFLVSQSFEFSGNFTLLRPKDVARIRFEVFVVPIQARFGEDGTIGGEALTIPQNVRDDFFDLYVNTEQADVVVSGSEINFAQGVDALKYEAEFPLPTPVEDRSYDILNISLNLKDYDALFEGERRDKTFNIFVVPSFEAS